MKPRNVEQAVKMKKETVDEAGNRIGVPTVMRVPAYRGFYVLIKNCVNLTDANRCAIYEDRPRACAEYEVGSDECLAARAAFGLDGHKAEAPLILDQPINVIVPKRLNI